MRLQKITRLLKANHVNFDYQEQPLGLVSFQLKDGPYKISETKTNRGLEVLVSAPSEQTQTTPERAKNLVKYYLKKQG